MSPVNSLCCKLLDTKNRRVGPVFVQELKQRNAGPWLLQGVPFQIFKVVDERPTLILPVLQKVTTNNCLQSIIKNLSH